MALPSQPRINTKGICDSCISARVLLTQWATTRLTRAACWSTFFFEETHSIGLQRHGKKSKGLVDFSKRFSAVSEYQDTCKARYGKFCQTSSLKLSFEYRRMVLQQDCFREIPHCYASMDRTGIRERERVRVKPQVVTSSDKWQVVTSEK